MYLIESLLLTFCVIPVTASEKSSQSALTNSTNSTAVLRRCQLFPLLCWSSVCIRYICMLCSSLLCIICSGSVRHKHLAKWI